VASHPGTGRLREVHCRRGRGKTGGDGLGEKGKNDSGIVKEKSPKFAAGAQVERPESGKRVLLVIRRIVGSLNRRTTRTPSCHKKWGLGGEKEGGGGKTCPRRCIIPCSLTNGLDKVENLKEKLELSRRWLLWGWWGPKGGKGGGGDHLDHQPS